MSNNDHVQIAEGTFRPHQANRAIYNANSKLHLPNVFRRWVVLDVIFDPYIFNENKAKELIEKHGNIPNIFEHSITRPPPRNSIIAKPVYNTSADNATEASTAMILYPMFPSSLSMPCKPGEHVWVMFESLTETVNLGYWICSIVGPGHVEDVNHSHYPRSIDGTFLEQENPNALEKLNNKKVKPRYHFKNGRYVKIVNTSQEVNDPMSSYAYDASSAMLISSNNDYGSLSSAYERILTESDGSAASVYESIPRFKKRPGDLALEGSNNTLIVLGRDRNGSAISYSTDENGLTVIDKNDPRASRRNAGSIDIVAGRGQTQRTGGSAVVNDLQNQELGKLKQSVTKDEGDPDFLNDRSRIYVSQNTFVDGNLGSKYFSSNASKTPPVLDSAEGDAGIIIKSDKVRIVARSDIQILVTGFENEIKESTSTMPTIGEEGEIPGDTITFSNTIKNENQNSNQWASITIKSNGDIVFQPSSLGYIKLGGDDADKGILCSTQPVIASNGGIAGTPIITTAGGQIGGSTAPSPGGNLPALPQRPDLDLGTFSNKVLIK